MRPLNLGETLDASIKIVRARWRTLAAVMLVIAVPIQLLEILIITSTTDVYQAGTSLGADSAATKTTYSNEGAYVAGQGLIVVLSILGYLLGTVACYRAIADTYLGRPTSARASLAFATRRLGATLWLTIVLCVALLAAFLALVIPGIWLAIAWTVAFPAMLVEGPGGVAALRRSFQLVQGRWWATFGRLAVAYILVAVVTSVASFLIVLPAVTVVDDTSFGALLLNQLGNMLVSLVTTPFIAAVTTLVYFDLRVRKEGFDLALLAERMGGGPAAGPAPAAAARPSAFGDPVTSVPPPSAAGRAPAPRPPSEPRSPGTWAPPLAPDPQRPPSAGE